MAEVDTTGAYEIEWQKKPLGFSIVMDTTGKNAYVSSIQKKENKDNGLKLAAQIIKINNEDVKNLDHKVILGKIKAATLPIKLMFQPRSFANEPQQDNVLSSLKFTGATVNKHRINGFFELTKEKYNGKHQWQRDDEETDPIILWFWPASKKANITGKDLWMIGRRSAQDTDGAYACCTSSEDVPTSIDDVWQCWDKEAINPKTGKPGAFVACQIKIAQEKQ